MVMMQFLYHGTDETGQDRSGSVEATSLSEAARGLRLQGITAHRLRRDDYEEISRPLDEMDSYAFFNRSLADLSRAGLPLPRALRTLCRGLRRGRFRKAVSAMERALHDGRSLSAAVKEVPGTFPEYYAEMIRAGEASGSLPRVLQAVARTHEGVRRARRAAISALSYPGMILALGLLFVLGVVGPLLTRLEDAYRGYVPDPAWYAEGFFRVFRDATIPLATVLGVGVTACLALWWMRNTPAGEAFLHRVPLIGRVMRTIVLARFLGTLSILLKAPLPVPEAVSLAAGACGGIRMARSRRRMSDQARDGRPIADVIEEAVPRAEGIPGYLRLAEESGDFPEACGDLADLLTEQSAAASDTIFVVLFPGAVLLSGLLLAPVFLATVSTFLDLLVHVAR